MKIAYDLETTGLDVHSCKILGIALCMKANHASYITYKDDEQMIERILNMLRPYFEDENIEKIGHNLKYDNQVLKSYGINVEGKLHDTMVTDYLLHPDRKQHGLKLLSKLHLNYQQIEFDDIAKGKTTKTKTLEGVDPNIVKDYACEDVDQTLQLHQLLYKNIEQQGMNKIYQLESDLIPVLTDMEYVGITIDLSKVDQIEPTIEKGLLELNEQIQQYGTTPVNINSTRDINHLLFDTLGIEPIGSKGKNRLYSVSSTILKKLVHKHKVVELIMEYRALNKVKTTFIKALKGTNPKTGRLHTSFNQTVAATGRMSSSGPNLQNIPSKTIGKTLRECFVASSPNHRLIGADFKNIELRLMATMSRDQVMIDAYKSGTDLHSLTASKVLDVPYSEVEKSQRNIGKLINFGLIYGMTAKGLSESLFNSTNKEYTVEQCQEFINQYFDLYRGVAQYREQLIYDVTINGYTETMFGRRRPLIGINSNDSLKREAAKRLAMNTPIQGTAADIIKIAMVNIHRRIKSEGLDSKMVLTVHDELIFDVPLGEVPLMEKLIKYEMENAVRLPIALEVDLQTGNNWAEVH